MNNGVSFCPSYTKWGEKKLPRVKYFEECPVLSKGCILGCISWIINSNCRIRSVGAATAHIYWFSPPNQPFITKPTVPMCCRASWNATTSSVTWIQLGNTQKTSIRITHPYPRWSVCWANTTSFPSLLSPTILTHTTRLVNFNWTLALKFLFFCGYYYYYYYFFFRLETQRVFPHCWGWSTARRFSQYLASHGNCLWGEMSSNFCHYSAIYIDPLVMNLFIFSEYPI